MTWPPTLADAPPAVLHELLVKREYGPLEATALPRTVTVSAPCCGARVPADAVRDLRAVAGTVIPRRGHGALVDLDWACDGCFELLVALPTNGWTRAKLARALGAPAAVIHEVRAQEIAEEARRGKTAADPLAELEQARRSLARGRRDLEGTGPPPAQGSA